MPLRTDATTTAHAKAHVDADADVHAHADVHADVDDVHARACVSALPCDMQAPVRAHDQPHMCLRMRMHSNAF